MIELSELKESDKGRMVIYRSKGGDKIERGIVSSWNDMFVFVRYELSYELARYSGAFNLTAAATYSEDLEFVE